MVLSGGCPGPPSLPLPLLLRLPELVDDKGDTIRQPHGGNAERQWQEGVINGASLPPHTCCTHPQTQVSASLPRAMLGRLGRATQSRLRARASARRADPPSGGQGRRHPVGQLCPACPRAGTEVGPAPAQVLCQGLQPGAGLSSVPGPSCSDWSDRARSLSAPSLRLSCVHTVLSPVTALTSNGPLSPLFCHYSLVLPQIANSLVGLSFSLTGHSCLFPRLFSLSLFF